MLEDTVVEAVRTLLQSSEGLPSERELARQINVNRHQIRRALEVLRETNEIEPASARRAAASLARGSVLARDTNPLEVLEVRMALEPALARLAAVRASPLDIARIQRAVAAQEGDSGANDLVFDRNGVLYFSDPWRSSASVMTRRAGSECTKPS